MRRQDREVTDPTEIVDIMTRCEVVRLAINTDTVPYILPVNFGMEPDGNTLYIHGALTGTKYDLLEKDNRVSFEMDCPGCLVFDESNHSCTMNYESVIGWGIVEELTGEGEKRRALDAIMAHYHGEDFPYSAEVIPRTRILRLNIMERTAKRRIKRR